MNIRATILAGLLGLPLFAGAALAAETVSLCRCREARRPRAVRSALNSVAKDDVAGAEGQRRADLGSPPQRHGDSRSSVARRRRPRRPPTITARPHFMRRGGNADPAIAAKLLAAGADANARLLVGRDAAHGGSRQGNVDTVRALLCRRRRSECAGIEWRADRPDVGDLGRHSAVTAELVRQQRRRQRPFEEGIHRVDVRGAQGDTDVRPRPARCRRQAE